VGIPGSSGHGGTGLICAVFTYCAIQQVDSVEEIHNWKANHIKNDVNFYFSTKYFFIVHIHVSLIIVTDKLVTVM